MDAMLEEKEEEVQEETTEKKDQPQIERVNSNAPWLTGTELLNDSKQNKRFLPTGLQGIDEILGGGLREGQLTEIAGPSSSGKTQVCLHSAVNIVDKQYGYVLYLDTCNSFSSKRISQFIGQLSPSVEEANERRLERIMSNIHCQMVFDVFALLDFLNQLELGLKHNKEKIEGCNSKLCLLIIDSISSLVAPILGGKNSHGRSILATIGIMLKQLAHEHNIAILVTNYMVGAEMGSLKPALGESWKIIPHLRILIGFRTNYRTAKILKHTLMVSGRTGTEFAIQN
ncbi:hypothetical protein LUZ60_009709 [Juncus effusus]|nr:hypothetical protein LUZ60_009709 [Juncus effusus]